MKIQLLLGIILLCYNMTLPALVAGTLIKTTHGFTLIEYLRVGDYVVTCLPNKSLSTSRVIKIAEDSTNTIVVIETDKGVVCVSKDQLLYDPVLNQWIQAQDLTINNKLIDYDFEQLQCLNIALRNEIITTYKLSLEYPHTFFVSDLQILTHNFVPLVLGISFAFGFGEGIAFSGIGASLGAWALWKYFKNRENKFVWFQQGDQHDQSRTSQNQKSNQQSGGPPEDPEDDFFYKLKSKASKKVRNNRFGNFYKDQESGLWWSKDRANHGNSQFKVFKETAKGLEWLYDADILGNPIRGKHKGPSGTFVSYKDIIVCQ